MTPLDIPMTCVVFLFFNFNLDCMPTANDIPPFLFVRLVPFFVALCGASRDNVILNT